jgi:hypothetical protein
MFRALSGAQRRDGNARLSRKAEQETVRNVTTLSHGCEREFEVRKGEFAKCTEMLGADSVLASSEIRMGGDWNLIWTFRSLRRRYGENSCAVRGLSLLTKTI